MRGSVLRTLCAAAVAMALWAVPAQAGVIDQQQPTIFGSCPSVTPGTTVAQTITAGATGAIDRVDVGLSSVNATTPLTVEIRTTSLGVPTSTVLGTATIAPAVYIGQFATALFAAPAPVTSGTTYAIVLRNPSATSFWSWCTAPGDPYPAGSPFTFAEPLGPWAPFSDDLAFVTYVGPAAPPSGPLFVDDDHVQCPTAAYTTIQSAVDAAGPGATINVCRGTYNESVTISGAGKDNLTLNSYTAPVAAVVKGATPFTVNGGAKGVSILKFRLEPTVTGISVSGGVAAPSSTALIRGNLVVGGQVGLKVLDAAAGTVRENSFLNQSQVGATVSADAFLEQASADVMNNTLTGGPGAFLGIAFSGAEGGATLGTMFANSVSKFGGPGLSVNNAGVAVKANNSFLNELGLRLQSGGSGAVENNKLNSNAINGVFVEADSTGHTFASNNASNNGGVDCRDDSIGAGTAGTANTWTANYGFESSPVGICKK